MRNLFYIIICTVLSFSFTSCVKDYTCQCEVSFSGKPGLPDSYIKDYTLSNTREKAAKECEEFSRVYTEDGITTREECELY